MVLRRFSTLKFFLIAFILFVVIQLFFLATYSVREVSMEPTLYNGDLLLVARSAYGVRLPFGGGYLFRYSTPQRGDIVVFRRNSRGEKYVKRVVAVPGDRLVFKRPVLFINGKKTALLPNASLNPFKRKALTVSQDMVFVLGDNAGSSEDSMVFGPIAIKDIMGRVLFRFYPLSHRRGVSVR